MNIRVRWARQFHREGTSQSHLYAKLCYGSPGVFVRVVKSEFRKVDEHTWSTDIRNILNYYANAENKNCEKFRFFFRLSSRSSNFHQFHSRSFFVDDVEVCIGGM